MIWQLLAGEIDEYNPASYKPSDVEIEAEEAVRKTEEKERKKEMKLKSQIEQLKIGMTKNMVLDVFGEAGSEKKTVARSGEKLIWFL